MYRSFLICRDVVLVHNIYHRECLNWNLESSLKIRRLDNLEKRNNRLRRAAWSLEVLIGDKVDLIKVRYLMSSIDYYSMALEWPWMSSNMRLAILLNLVTLIFYHM